MSSHVNNRVLTVILFITLSAAGLSAQPQVHDPWKPLQFLIGTWIGNGSGSPGEMIKGTSTFSFELDKNILTRRNRVETVSTVHEDLLIVYPKPGESAFCATYFDNEKHVIQYAITIPRDRLAIFESKTVEKAPSFRLVYELTTEDTLTTDFLIAFPGGDFKSYIKGKAYKMR